MFIVLHIILVYCCSCSNAILTTDIVYTDSVPVKGIIEKTLFDQKEYYSFKGIPYAKAPIGDLRFVAPTKYFQPHPILAFEHGSICLQSGEMGPVGNENCLFLNVYTPTLTPNASLAVMFFIHGGAYLAGSGNDDIYGPDFLIEESVIVVTINYRLGVFGFMSLGDSKFSGNMGLKDQLLALKWVRNNIRHFGGNKNLITISGQSAGSRAVQYFTLSSATKNLFKRAIAMSGTVTDLWSRSYNSSHIDEVTKFAQQQNNSNIQSVKDVIEFVQNVDANDILNHFPLNIDVTNAQPIHVTPPFTPVVEIENAEHPFLQQPPEAILFNPLQRSDVDMMFGTTSEESLGLLSTFFLKNKSSEALNKYFRIPFPNRFFIPDFESAAYANASMEIRNFYLGSSSAQINATNMLSVVNLISDVLANHEFVRSIIAQQLRSDKQTAVYKISASTKLNYAKAKAGIASVDGASHEDDLCYVFACKIAPDIYKITKGSVEMKLLKGFTRMFANFVKYGDTGFGLGEANSSMQYVHISNDGFNVESELFSQRVQFWNNLMEKYSEMNIFSKLHPGSV